MTLRLAVLAVAHQTSMRAYHVCGTANGVCTCGSTRCQSNVRPINAADADSTDMRLTERHPIAAKMTQASGSCLTTMVSPAAAAATPGSADCSLLARPPLPSAATTASTCAGISIPGYSAARSTVGTSPQSRMEAGSIASKASRPSSGAPSLAPAGWVGAAVADAHPKPPLATPNKRQQGQRQQQRQQRDSASAAAAMHKPLPALQQTPPPRCTCSTSHLAWAYRHAAAGDGPALSRTDLPP